jgi:tetratricopeptide (TPR) repeat protein
VKFRLRRFIGALLAVVFVATAVSLIVGVARDGSVPPTSPASAALTPIGRYQQTLRDNPADHATWAKLGLAYVEQARATFDPTYYPKAEGALRRSLELAPGDHPAMIGMAALANSRHDFAGAVTWALKAKKISPDTPAVYGALADAYTQLGDAPAATSALARMAVLEPGVSAFTRLSYDFEQRGDNAKARELLKNALDDAYEPAEKSFCHFYLGELAFHAGDLDGAEAEYKEGLAVDPSSVQSSYGLAKVAALRGDKDQAVERYDLLVSRVPAPQYLIEYAQFLTSLGRKDEAKQQLDILAGLRQVFTANGVVDDLTWSEYAADTGDKAGALTSARAEWKRRHNVIVADSLAWALHLNGDDKEALRFAKLATAPGWRNALFQFHLSEIESSLGQDAAARRSLARAHEFNPRFDPKLPALGRTA